MGTEKLQAYIELAQALKKMQALAQRYQAAAKKDAAASVQLSVVIDGVAIPQADLAPIARALSNRVRLSLPQLLAAAINDAAAEVQAAKAAAKAEYDALFV